MKIFLTACVACLPGAAFAASLSFVVSAEFASYSDGTGSGLNTGTAFDAGDAFQISADETDTWTLGLSSSSEPTRTGNADGLTGFSNYVTSDLSALFGTLVGRIGDGNFFSIGTSFDGTAANAGVLSLFAWDSNSEDNSGDIRVTVTTPDGPDGVVPLPASLPLMLGALGLVGFIKRRFA